MLQIKNLLYQPITIKDKNGVTIFLNSRSKAIVDVEKDNITEEIKNLESAGFISVKVVEE